MALSLVDNQPYFPQEITELEHGWLVVGEKLRDVRPVLAPGHDCLYTGQCAPSITVPAVHLTPHTRPDKNTHR